MRISPPSTRKTAAKLDEYYIPTRYPNSLPGGVTSRFFTDPVEVKEAQQLTHTVIDTVRQKLGLRP